MTLNQIAQQAMDYLDSVGVAADYEVGGYITITTDDFRFTNLSGSDYMMARIKYRYPQKSPA